MSTKISNILQGLMGDMSEAALARAVNLPKATINRVLSGSTPDPRAGTLLPIAKYFNVTIEQLMGESDLSKETPLYLADNPCTMKLPFIELNLIKKWIDGEYNPEKFYETVPFFVHGINNDCFITKIDSDEMLPLLPIGSYLIVVKKKTMKRDDVVILECLGDIIIRKCLELKGSKYLVSPNPINQIIAFDDEMDIIGVVVEGRIVV